MSIAQDLSDVLEAAGQPLAWLDVLASTFHRSGLKRLQRWPTRPLFVVAAYLLIWSYGSWSAWLFSAANRLPRSLGASTSAPMVWPMMSFWQKVLFPKPANVSANSLSNGCSNNAQTPGDMSVIPRVSGMDCKSSRSMGPCFELRKQRSYALILARAIPRSRGKRPIRGCAWSP